MVAMEMIGMDPVGTWHVGRDDAFNIARVLRHLMGFDDA
jgi:inhibitor of KinA sporulation pathway (predicted exonuclease)